MVDIEAEALPNTDMIGNINSCELRVQAIDQPLALQRKANAL